MAILNSLPRSQPSYHPKSWWWLPLLALRCVALTAFTAEPTVFHEYEVKAVYLFNFAQFVDWPPDAFVDPQSPLILGVLGKDPFAGLLDDAVRGEKVNGRFFVIQRYNRVEEIKDCHILFISRSETARLGQVLDAVRDRGILTVSDADGFAQRGGMIRFVIEQNKVRFRVNLESVKAAKLTVSSKLLRAANIVVPGKE